MGCVYNIIICIYVQYLSKHKYNKKTCIKIVPTDCLPVRLIREHNN